MKMRSLPLPLAVLLTLVSLQCTQAADATPPATAASPLTEGRVVDGEGVGVGDVTLRLMGAGQPKVEGRCCGNYRIMDYAYTDSEGRFSKDLHFLPATVAVDTVPEDFALPSEEVPITPGTPVEVKLQRIAWIIYEGQVVDAQRAPVAWVTIEPGGETNETGHFKVKINPEAPVKRLRFRKIGFRPVEVPVEKMARVMLVERRPLLTVKLQHKGTLPQAVRMYKVEAFRGTESFSSCMAGVTQVKKEPAKGECTLDAEPGEVELSIDGKPVRKLQVTYEPQTVTLDVTSTD